MTVPHTSAPGPLEIEPATIALALTRNWTHLLGGVVVGLVGAALVVAFVPAQFEGRALVLIRTPQSASSMLSQQLGPLADIAPSALGISAKADLATELALMQSRAVASRAVDSLRLQVLPKNPDRVAPATLVDSVRLTGRFKPRDVSLHAGTNDFPEGTVFARASLTGEVRVKLFDREDAIDDVAAGLDVKTQAGDVARIRYRSADSVTAAEVPNLVTAVYLERRRTTDRGLNQRRFDFLNAKADSVATDLKRAARALRETQEMQRLFAAEPTARALFERLGAGETQLALVRADQGALDSILSRAGRPGFDPRTMAGVPSLLKSSAVNDLLAQLDNAQAQRTTLLVSASATAPAVVAFAQIADSLRAQLVPLARTYADALARQRESLESDGAVARAAIAALPAQAEKVVLREAALKRISTIDAGMGMQLLDARLAAIAEGGDVRLVDAAVSPRKVAYPRPSVTFALGAALGLALGGAWALMMAGSNAGPREHGTVRA